MIRRYRGGGRRGADRRAGEGWGGQRRPRRLHQLGNLVLVLISLTFTQLGTA